MAFTHLQYFRFEDKEVMLKGQIWAMLEIEYNHNLLQFKLGGCVVPLICCGKKEVFATAIVL